MNSRSWKITEIHIPIYIFPSLTSKTTLRGIVTIQVVTTNEQHVLTTQKEIVVVVDQQQQMTHKDPFSLVGQF